MLRIDINLVFTIINLIVLYLAMKKFLIAPVMGIIEQRKVLIANQLENAKKTTDEANALKKHYESVVKDINEQSDEMLEKARNDAKGEYERIVELANQNSRKIVKESEKTIDFEREKALREMESQIASLAMSVAVKVVGEKNDELIDKSIYNQFLLKVGEPNDTNSN